MIAADIVSTLLGKVTETVVIAGIVLLFAALSFAEEYRAEWALAALRKLAILFVRVICGGAQRELTVDKLVPGEMVLLEAGASIPADLRFLESFNVRVQQSTLSGASQPTQKQTGAYAAA